MIMRRCFLSIGSALALAGLALVMPPAFASVPDPAALQWDEVAETLNDRTLPLSWHDSRGNSMVYYHLHFGTEHDAVEVLKRARAQRTKLIGLESLAHFAVIKDKEFALRELLASGISPNAKLHKESLLMAAAHEGHLGIMRLLIASGADVNYGYRVSIDPKPWSDAATYALRAGKYYAARLLFSSGYNITKGGPAHTTKLFFAAIAGGSAQAVRYMLDHFTLIDTVNADGETPLTFAVQTETTDHVISELLLRGADPCKRNKAGQSVEELLAEVNKGKKSYDARFVWVSDRLICQHKQ